MLNPPYLRYTYAQNYLSIQIQISLDILHFYLLNLSTLRGTADQEPPGSSLQWLSGGALTPTMWLSTNSLILDIVATEIFIEQGLKCWY